MTTEPYAYDSAHDTMHKSTCPAVITETTEPTDRQLASMRLMIGVEPCPVCMPHGLGERTGGID